MNLQTGAASGDGSDILSGFENVTGSAFDDAHLRVAPGNGKDRLRSEPRASRFDLFTVDRRRDGREEP